MTGSVELGDGADRRRGESYLVSADELEAFRRDGYVHLRGVMSPEEMDSIEQVYDLSLIHI